MGRFRLSLVTSSPLALRPCRVSSRLAHVMRLAIELGIGVVLALALIGGATRLRLVELRVYGGFLVATAAFYAVMALARGVIDALPLEARRSCPVRPPRHARASGPPCPPRYRLGRTRSLGCGLPYKRPGRPCPRVVSDAVRGLRFLPSRLYRWAALAGGEDSLTQPQ